MNLKTDRMDFITSMVGGTTFVLICENESQPPVCDIRDAVQVHHLCWKSLSLDQIAQIRPDAILSPLVVGNLDALDIATLLQSSDYKCPYRVIGSVLPSPAMVAAEVATAAPTVDFAIL